MDELTAQNMIIWVAVGGGFGWIADAAFKLTRLGSLGNIIVGTLGAFAAAWLSVRLDVWVDTGNPFLNQALTAFLGSIVALMLVSAYERRNR
jgi:uncharacterized membrane protein YeaQ/YmgE (transglycosylase-associated protein family)